MKTSRATFCPNYDGREISSLRGVDQCGVQHRLVFDLVGHFIGFLDDAVDGRTDDGLDLRAAYQEHLRQLFDVARTEQRHRFVAVVPNSRVCGCLLTSETGPVDGTFDIATYMENAILTCERSEAASESRDFHHMNEWRVTTRPIHGSRRRCQGLHNASFLP
jgi:hypothetical protein